ncbi:SEL1-like repeat protein [Aeromonas rivuli]|uniref:SEL1-like repeat protein n=1 Tax=Aeromonas rivuli TaxID=648794 RepID=UPI0005A96283|nr:tetratricopeptide repeat protein [Aeromonas rivuli]
MKKRSPVLLVLLLAGCASQPSHLSDAELQTAAQQGQGQAQYELAERLAAKPDYPAAMHWMKQASKLGTLNSDGALRGKAALQVGNWYHAGLGEPRNQAQAREWWQSAARLGNDDAGYQLGLDCQSRHKGKLPQECLDWLTPAAEEGHVQAQLLLGQWYAVQPEGGEDALRWLTASAKQGDRQAQYQLGQRYEQGVGVTKSQATADEWYRKAAAQQQPDALLILARQADAKQATPLYQRAAEAGSAEAQRWLGLAYMKGDPLPPNPTQGQYWLTLAAGQGDHQAEYQLSLQQSEAAQRQHWLTLAADGGVARAQYELGQLRQQSGDLEAARREYARAAAQNEADARYAYGEMQRLGQGGKADYSAALKEYRLAANQGHQQSQYRMGMMREQGLGAPRNQIQAYAWYLLAATNGEPEASQARDELEQALQPKEKQAGQKLAQYWYTKLGGQDQPFQG